MNYPAYPSDVDLQNFLTSLGLWTSSLSTFSSGWAQAAINKFEMLTGRQPFLALTTPVSAFYDPPGSVSQSYYYPWRGGQKNLELDNSFVSISDIIVGWSTANVGNSLNLPGSVNQNCRFLPINYNLKGIPIDEIEFYFNDWGIPGSIMIVGIQGYSTTVPADVWTAILQEAASLFVTSFRVILSDGLTSVSEADIDLKFPEDMLGTMSDRWHQLFMMAVNRYKLIRYMGW